MISAIFFDFDGVLVDTEPLHYACWIEALAGQGIRITAEDYARRFTGVSDSAMIDELCREFGGPGDRSFFAACKKRKTALYRERAPAACHIREELRMFLTTRRQIYSIGVVSSSSRLDVEPHLVSQGVRDSLTALVCCEDVRRLKPAPDPYLRALEVIRASVEGLRAEQCLVVEDSEPGAEAGRRAGMRVVRVPGPEAVVGMVTAALA